MKKEVVDWVQSLLEFLMLVYLQFNVVLLLVQSFTGKYEDVGYIKPKVESIDKTLSSIKWVLITIALAMIANIFSQPILAWLNL
ncbi:MAG: hypothetical protein AB4372_03865 [Xenococcus sp. (in: cyanobacteria)]